MLRSFIFRVLVQSLLVAIAWPLPTQAQTDSPTGMKSMPDEGEIVLLTDPDAWAEVQTPDGPRRIEIYRSDPASRKKELVDAYHRPLFWFTERSEPLPGYPSVVQAVYFDKQGLAHLHFHVVLSSIELRALCRDALYDQRPELIRDELKRDQATLKVARWPVKHVVFEFYDLGTGAVLGQGAVFNIDAVVDEFDIRVAFPPSSLVDFVKYAEEGRIGIRPTYSYRARSIVSGERVSIGEVKIEHAMESELSSAQIEGEVPIFQNDVHRVVSKVAVSMRTRVSVQQPGMVALFGDSTGLIDRLFAQSQLSYEVLNADPVKAAAFSKYLEPHLHTLSETISQTDSTVDTSEDEDTEVTGTTKTRTKVDGRGTKAGTKGGYQGVYGSYFGGVGSNWSTGNKQTTTSRDEQIKRILSRFEEITGVRGQWNESTSSFEPHEVTVFTAKANVQSMKLDDIEILTVGGTASRAFDTGFPFSLQFVSSAFGTLEETSEVAEGYNRVPVGGMLPFFGHTPPPGWVWFEPDQSFGEHKNFAPHLLGQAIPDLNGRTLGSTTVEEEVGTLYDPEIRKLSIPKQEIEAYWAKLQDFQLDTGTARILEPSGKVDKERLADRKAGRGAKTYFSTESRDGRRTLSHGATESWSLASSLVHRLHDLEEFDKRTFLDRVDIEQKKKGRVRVNQITIDGKTLTIDESDPKHLPPQVKCRWIIRVR